MKIVLRIGVVLGVLMAIAGGYLTYTDPGELGLLLLVGGLWIVSLPQYSIPVFLLIPPLWLCIDVFHIDILETQHILIAISILLLVVVFIWLIKQYVKFFRG